MLPRSVRIWLATEPTDMRRGHDGLMALAKNVLGLDPFSGHLVVFLGKRRDRCKVVFFDRGGFVLYYKRLERGRFSPPKMPTDGSPSVSMDATTLAMLLDGIDVSRVRRPPMWEPKKVHPVEEGSTSRSRSDLTTSWPKSAPNRRR